MHKQISSLLLLCVLLLNIQTYAQKKSDFTISIPTEKIDDAKYNKLQYLDYQSSPNDLNIGYVYINSWNGVQSATLSTPLHVQLDSLIKSITPNLSKDKTLALQMRTLYFSIGERDPKDKSLCNIRLTLYEVDDDNPNEYYFLSTLDTLVISDSKKIRLEASNAITTFISNNIVMTAENDEPAITIDNVNNIELFERNNIPFYTQQTLPDGIYTTYKSLKNLIPDAEANNMHYDEESKSIKIVTGEKQTKLDSKNVYAVVIDGIPYVKFDKKFHKAYTNDDDWCFVITQKVQGSGFTLGVGVGAGSYGSRTGVSGGIGIPISIGGKKENIEMFIDHLNGDFYWGGRVDKKDKE